MSKDFIYVDPSPTADSRTCDYSKVDMETLRRSSIRHINDVQKGMDYLRDILNEASKNHDHTKLEEITRFHEDFVANFKGPNTWWRMHLKAERHHLNVPDGIRDDVNLLDVLEHIVDNVMAALARKGTYTPSVLSDELLQKAYANTEKLLLDHTIVTGTPNEEKKPWLPNGLK